MNGLLSITSNENEYVNQILTRMRSAAGRWLPLLFLSYTHLKTNPQTIKTPYNPSRSCLFSFSSVRSVTIPGWLIGAADGESLDTKDFLFWPSCESTSFLAFEFSVGSCLDFTSMPICVRVLQVLLVQRQIDAVGLGRLALLYCVVQSKYPYDVSCLTNAKLRFIPTHM